MINIKKNKTDLSSLMSMNSIKIQYYTILFVLVTTVCMEMAYWVHNEPGFYYKENVDGIFSITNFELFFPISNNISFHNELVLKKQLKIFVPQMKIIQTYTNPSFYMMTLESMGERKYQNHPHYQLMKKINLCSICMNNPEMMVVDVGGYLGEFGLYAAKCGCGVFIFEPHPLFHSLIQMSITLNGLEKRVILYNHIVAPLNTVFLNLQLNDTFNPTVGGNINDNTFIAKTISLGHVLYQNRIFVIKVDVDGMESAVLFNASISLLRDKRFTYIISKY